MNKSEQKHIVLLYAIMSLNGADSKQNILDYIQENGYWYKKDDNDVLCKSRPEKKWRNNFAYVRRNLVDNGYMDNRAKDWWELKEEGVTYFYKLLEKAKNMTPSDNMLFTKTFLKKMYYEEENPEETEDRILIKSLNKTDGSNIQTDIALSNEPKPKGEAVRHVNKKPIYRRDPSVSLRALEMAGNSCAVNPEHKSFLRKNSDCLYMEPHHLIPISMTDYYGVSLDREQNIFSLCSNCHNQIHYGTPEDVRHLIAILFKSRENEICSIIGKRIQLEEIYKIYNAL